MNKTNYSILFALVIATCIAGCGPSQQDKNEEAKKESEAKAHNESTKSKIKLSPGRNW